LFDPRLRCDRGSLIHSFKKYIYERQNSKQFIFTGHIITGWYWSLGGLSGIFYSSSLFNLLIMKQMIIEMWLDAMALKYYDQLPRIEKVLLIRYGFDIAIK
jgi:hypothetical protein